MMKERLEEEDQKIDNGSDIKRADLHEEDMEDLVKENLR